MIMKRVLLVLPPSEGIRKRNLKVRLKGRAKRLKNLSNVLIICILVCCHVLTFKGILKNFQIMNISTHKTVSILETFSVVGCNHISLHL